MPAGWCTNIVNQPVGTEYDTYHINSIEPDGDGYVMSFRHLDAVYRVNKSDGSIDWKLGGVAQPASLNVVGDSFPAGDQFRGQHDARILSDGSLTVHDNGFIPGNLRAPRAVRFALDLNARTATLAEQKKTGSEDR